MLRAAVAIKLSYVLFSAAAFEGVPPQRVTEAHRGILYDEAGESLTSVNLCVPPW